MFLFIVWQKKSQYSKNYQKLFRNISNLLEHNYNNGKSELRNFKDELTDIFRRIKSSLKKHPLKQHLVGISKTSAKKKKKKKKKQPQTAKHWVLHISYLSAMKRFIITKRTSDWSLHIDRHYVFWIDLLCLMILTMPNESKSKKCKILLKSILDCIKKLSLLFM